MALQGLIANTILNPHCTPSEFVRVPSKAAFRTRASAGCTDNNVRAYQQSVNNNCNGTRRPFVQQNFPRMRRGTGMFWNPLMNPYVRAQTFGQLIEMVNQMMNGQTSMTRQRYPWDAMEDEHSYMMRIDMPGLTKDEVKLSINDGYLVIKGETGAERREGDKWAARSVGSYEFKLMVPENGELEEIKAEFKDGVLYVTLPKKKVEEKKPIDIEIV